MAYNKTVWTNKITKVSAGHMNNIENGIYAAHQAISELEQVLTEKTEVEQSAINGNIKINGIDRIIYTHPNNHPAHIITLDSQTFSKNLNTDVDTVQKLAESVDQLVTVVTNIAGDIPYTTYNAFNNTTYPTDVEGLTFNSANVRGFEALLSVEVTADDNLYETFKILGVYTNTGWQITISSVGNTSGFTFTISENGTIQYTNLNYPGFINSKIKFRAIIT